MITAKLRRGPGAGRFLNIDSMAERIEWQVPDPRPVNVARFLDPVEVDAMLTFKRGHYQRTNIRTKSGAYVYEWMGFYNEIQK